MESTERVWASDDRLGAVFSALADPTRRALVARLADGDATVSELAAGFPVGVAAISKHLTVLQGAGLISRHREAQWRHCRLEADAFERLAEWMSHYTRLWTGSLDRLDLLMRDPDLLSGPDPSGKPDDASAQGGRP